MNRTTTLRITTIAIFIAVISLLHYFTPLSLIYLHHIFQRLYYLPIILAALWFGLRGGLLCSLLVSCAYAPHILFQWSGELVVEIEKYLEIVVYNVVGGLTGLLAQRERERSRELQRSAAVLEESYAALQSQSERIMAVEEQLRRTERLSAVGEMAAVLAHEIRNPLGSIRGTAEILRDDYQPGDPKHEFITIQIKETERLNHVVEDFLRMARQQPLVLNDCSVVEELSTVVTLLARGAQERGVELRLDSVGVIPVIRADGDKLRQAFLNIIINALQATPAGGSVTILPERVDSGVLISVRDSGSGIVPEDLQRIFEPFYTTKTDGTGLGMSITRKIIEGHGGTLEVESNIGIGTVVTVRLPDRIVEQP